MIVNYKWLLIPHITNGWAIFLVVVTTLEFSVAQSPRQMRGLMVGLCYAIYGIGRLLSINLSWLLVYFEFLSRGCTFYYHLGSIIVSLILFLIFAKHYKLRVRNDIYPVHQIATEHYERYLDQQEEHERMYYGSSSIQ